ncbi:MAG: nucleotide exchange factor GrpE [Rikenellaceae bacterium]
MKESKKHSNTTENEDVKQPCEAPTSTCETNDEQTVTDTMTDESFENSDNESVLAEEVKEWQDKYLRLSAEFDNYRKRTLKEKMDLIENASEDVIKSILSIIDDLDRAALAMETTTDIEAVKNGIELIRKRMTDILKQKGLSEIESLGAELNTDFHDAIAKFPVEDEMQKGKVIDVVEKGYKIKDKVIRFAKVVVGE